MCVLHHDISLIQKLYIVKNGLEVWIEKQTEHRPETALLVDRGRNGEQAVCQKGGAPPESL